MAWKVSSRRESSETVTRLSPASLRACAFCARTEPFVVIARSGASPSGVRKRASIRTSSSMSFRNRGSPPVSRIFRTPCPTAIEASLVISSNVSSWSRA
ncbi:hypothetical protein AHiyo8_27640 [Arthrobacter sp. Hiyo8]|nr:hypothetical protein AHiyo8_27640 [Arthrobacter sp. Hiyo8]